MISIEVVEEEKDIIYNYHETKNFKFENFSDSREKVRSVAKNVNKGGRNMKENRKYYVELSKDLGLFTAGVIVGPAIDFAMLIQKHGPILHRKISRKINEKIKFYRSVR
ncbi:MAG: hypothetical protein ACP5IB_08955 [Thermoplasmata archaeon]